MKPSDLKKQAQELIARGEKTKLYCVMWEFDLDAVSPRAAAEKALEIFETNQFLDEIKFLVELD